MDREAIGEELKAMATRMAEISNEIAKDENAFGVRITLNVVNVAGVCQVSIDAKTSGKDSLDKSVEALEQLAQGLGIPLPPKEEEKLFNVDDELKNILGKRPEQK